MKVAVCLFFVAFLSSFINCAEEYGPFSSKVINIVVDKFLKFLRMYIRHENMDRINVPDLNVEFEGPLSMKGTFNASNGSVAHLSTVYRTGDAKVSYNKSMAITLAFGLGLEHLVVDYNQYKASIVGISTSGIMRATISRNSLYVTLNFLYNFFKCSQDVGIVKMDQFSDIDVELTGLGPLSWLLDRVTSWIAEDFRDNIKHIVEDNIRKALKSAMAKYNLCKIIPPLLTSALQNETSNIMIN